MYSLEMNSHFNSIFDESAFPFSTVAMLPKSSEYINNATLFVFWGGHYDYTFNTNDNNVNFLQYQNDDNIMENTWKDVLKIFTMKNN